MVVTNSCFGFGNQSVISSSQLGGAPKLVEFASMRMGLFCELVALKLFCVFLFVARCSVEAAVLDG